MSKGLLDLPGAFNSYVGDAAKGVVGKRVSPGVGCERTLLPGIFVRQAVPLSTASAHFLAGHNGNAAAALGFTRYLHWRRLLRACLSEALEIILHGSSNGNFLEVRELAFEFRTFRTGKLEVSKRNLAQQYTMVMFPTGRKICTLPVCPGLKDAGLQGLGRRTRCRCLSEMPTEGDFRPVESSTSPDGASSEGEANVESASDQPFFQDVQIDLNFPRRRMLVEFTCNKCNSRTQRVINPEAYRRGTVFVQCGGCEVYHQLVDNLNLIQEFDFREDEI